MTKQGVSLLFYLFGLFHFRTYISPDVWRRDSANKYKSSTYVILRHPVIARHALFSYMSNMSAYIDLAHTGAAYSDIDCTEPVLLFLGCLHLFPTLS